MDNKKKGRNILIVVLLLISAVAVCVTIWALFFRDDGQLTPDYAPVDEEANAEEIPDDSGEKMEVPEGGGRARPPPPPQSGKIESGYRASAGDSGQCHRAERNIGAWQTSDQAGSQ